MISIRISVRERPDGQVVAVIKERDGVIHVEPLPDEDEEEKPDQEDNEED